MPHKCVRCGKVHPDDAEYLLEGCDVCGCRFFLYVSYENLHKSEDLMKDLSSKEIEEIEKDIRAIIAQEYGERAREDVVILDIESIRVVKPGKYLIDVVNLFSQRPIVIRVAPGKYRIDLSSILPKR